MQADGYRANGLAAAVEAAEAAAAVSDSLSLRCQVVLQMTAVLCGAGRHNSYVNAVDRLLDDASDGLSPAMRGSLLVARSIGCYHRGSFAEAERGFEAARDLLSISAPSDTERLGGADAVVAAASYASLTMQILGRLETAHATQRIAEARARSLNDPFSLAWALFGRARTYCALGEWEPALEDAEETVTIARQFGFSAFVARGLEFRGRARGALGDAAAGIEDCREALRLWSKSGVVQTTPNIAAILAELLVGIGHADHAGKVLDDVDALVEGTDEAAALAECQRVRGLTALADGRLPEAVRWLEMAVETSRNQGARLYELRATTSLAEVNDRYGGTRDVRHALADLYGWFTEGHRAPDLQRAKTALDHMSRENDNT